jgi:hypothetical protein
MQNHSILRIFICICVAYAMTNSNCFADETSIPSGENTEGSIQVRFEVMWSDRTPIDYFVGVLCTVDGDPYSSSSLVAIGDDQGEAFLTLGPQDFDEIKISIWEVDPRRIIGRIETRMNLSTCPTEFILTYPSDEIKPNNRFYIWPEYLEFADRANEYHAAKDQEPPSSSQTSNLRKRRSRIRNGRRF